MCLSHENKTWELITTEVEEVIEVLIFMYLVVDVWNIFYDTMKMKYKYWSTFF